MVGDYDFIKEGARILCEIEDGTYELRLVPKRRRGRFKLSMGYLECDENVNKLIFERVLVSMCRVDYASATVKFEGCSMDFDVVGDTEETPEYLFTFIQEGTDPVYISKVERVDL